MEGERVIRKVLTIAREGGCAARERVAVICRDRMGRARLCSEKSQASVYGVFESSLTSPE